MSTTFTPQTSSILWQPQFLGALSGDKGGSEVPGELLKFIQTWSNTGGTAPTWDGWLYGEFTVSAGDILAAHATTPVLGSAANATYSTGLTSNGKKPKLIYLRNTIAVGGTGTFTVIRGAANGLPVFLAANDGLTLTPGGVWIWSDPAGSVVGALSSGSNDKLTLAVTAGTPTAELLIVYGS